LEHVVDTALAHVSPAPPQTPQPSMWPASQHAFWFVQMPVQGQHAP
jgi:hypothetical protein